MSVALDTFLREQIVSAPRARAPRPDPAACAVVQRVAPVSLAGTLGVRPGDLLVTANGQPGSAVTELSLLPTGKDTAAYTFWLAATQELVKAQVRGVDPGIAICPTPEAAVLPRADHEAICAAASYLWEEGRWADLEKVCRAGILGLHAWWERLLLFGGVPATSTPLTALRAAALLELGDPKGPALMKEYEERFIDAWTLNYAALPLYYRFRDAAPGDTRATSALRRVWESWPCERTAAPLRKRGVEPVDSAMGIVGKPFPLRYDLRAVDGGPGASLAATLGAMGPDQLLFVCVLGPYRGNGPYDDFVTRFCCYRRSMGARIHALHVLTSTRERRADRAHWFRAEDRALAAGCPLRVLHDERDAALRALGSTGSPDVVVVDARGVIVYRGELPSDAWWTLLGRLSA